VRIQKRNIGLHHNRVNYDYGCGIKNSEKIFQEEWNKENTSDQNLGFGFGMLQDLFLVNNKIAEQFDGKDQDNITANDRKFGGRLDGTSQIVYKISEREHRIAATVIQWLGTNIGTAFLKTCFGKMGYKLVRKEE